MEKADLIPAEDFCSHHSVSYTFVSGLCDAGLAEVVTIEEVQYIHPDCVADLEKLVRLHADLDINMEGIEAIAHLLQQVSDLRVQLKNMTQQLDMYKNT